MKHLRKMNEGKSVVTLRDLIGDPLEKGDDVYNAKVIETSKGCFTNINLEGYRGDSPLDKEVKLGYVSGKEGELVSDLMVKGEKYMSQIGYCHIERNEDSPIGYDIKILSYYPGDERGCLVFNNTFICSGHDGSYLWDINNPTEFVSNTY